MLTSVTLNCQVTKFGQQYFSESPQVFWLLPQWVREGHLAPQASSMRRLSKSSLQAATYNRRSTFSLDNKYFRLFSSRPLDHVVRQSSACSEQSEMSGVGQGSGKIRGGEGGASNRGRLFGQGDWQEGNLRFHQHFLVLAPPALWANLTLFINWVYEVDNGWVLWRCLIPEVPDREHTQMHVVFPTQQTPGLGNNSVTTKSMSI